jgi:ribosomal protein L28
VRSGGFKVQAPNGAWLQLRFAAAGWIGCAHHKEQRVWVPNQGVTFTLQSDGIERSLRLCRQCLETCPQPPPLNETRVVN